MIRVRCQFVFFQFFCHSPRDLQRVRFGLGAWFVMCDLTLTLDSSRELVKHGPLCVCVVSYQDCERLDIYIL